MDKAVLLAQTVGDLMDNLPAFIAKVKFDAALHREKYKELIRLGFDKSEALELCKKIYGSDV